MKKSRRADVNEMTKTSLSHPLRIDSVSPLSVAGEIGMTFCPGKKQFNCMSGGNWSRDLETDIAAIVSWGATALLNLMEDHELQELQVTQLQVATEAKLAYYRLPIMDGDVPDKTCESAWLQLGAELRRRLTLGERIVIHCKGGLGRTGTIAAKLLIELGEDPESAMARVRNARPGAIETTLQEEYLRSCRSLPHDLLDSSR